VHDFADLLRATDAVAGLERIRYTSPHPSDMSERVIAAMAECPKVMPQVHLPMQSGSDRILEAMNRTYDQGAFRRVVDRLRAAIPELALSTDIIVGFPGETEADYEATVSAMREIRFDSAFLFKYSARPDTKAWRWPETVSEAEKGQRLQRLIDFQLGISGEHNDRWVGREVEVLVESPARRSPNQLYGKTPQFKAVVFPNDGTAPGALRRVRIAGSTPITLIGAVVETPSPPALLQIS